MGKGPIVKKNAHAAALPSLEWIRGVRELGARMITTADMHIEFGEAPPPLVVQAKTPWLKMPTSAGVRRIDDPDRDVAEDELTAEELKEKERQEAEALLLASAD